MKGQVVKIILQVQRDAPSQMGMAEGHHDGVPGVALEPGGGLAPVQLDQIRDHPEAAVLLGAAKDWYPMVCPAHLQVCQGPQGPLGNVVVDDFLEMGNVGKRGWLIQWQWYLSQR